MKVLCGKIFVFDKMNHGWNFNLDFSSTAVLFNQFDVTLSAVRSVSEGALIRSKNNKSGWLPYFDSTSTRQQILFKCLPHLGTNYWSVQIQFGLVQIVPVNKYWRPRRITSTIHLEMARKASEISEHAERGHILLNKNTFYRIQIYFHMKTFIT